MARVTYVKKAKGRKDGRPRRCAGCGTEILPGQSYKWFANRIGRMSMRKDFCANCRIRPSMMTTSPHLSALYAAQEAAEDALGTGDDLGLADISQIVRDYAEAVREVGAGYRESAEAIVDGFGHETYQSEEIAEKADECESAADTIESAADDIEDLDDPDADESEFVNDYEGELDERGEPVDIEAYDQHVEDKREERREAALEAANEALAEGPQL